MEKSQWEIYLEEKKQREEKMEKVSIFDLLDKDKYSKNKEEIDRRISICESCDHFIKMTKQCSKCGCFMQLKTRLTNASCPIGKW
jgi:NADH pyrophosphatase NudC (nudix superfamily)